ncbi:MAG: ThuA domain-containing protein [Verrucomicrobiae bacterium]|nr:ThuA domain-containing protein [Verrucomicrobiae bacterium]
MKKALIFQGGWDGHHPLQSAQIFAEVLRKENFEVEISDTLDVLLNREKLAGLNLIVPLWTMGTITGEQEQALCTAVRESGVGLGGFHGGMCDAFRNSCDYQMMTGGQFVGHPGNCVEHIVHVTDRTDPVMDGIRDFKLNTERYYMHVDPSNRVLATLTFAGHEVPGGGQLIMPTVWKRMHGKGRVFYASWGHQPSDFEVPEAKEIVRRGMLWAAL